MLLNRVYRDKKTNLLCKTAQDIIFFIDSR